MSGGPKQTATTSQTTETGPWQPSQDALKGILGQASGMLPNTGINPTENAALGGLAGNAQTAAGYGSQIQGVTDKLFAGGGYGAGVPGVKQAWQTAQGALSPIASGNLDPMQNPQMQQMIQQITDQARNSVGAQFAAAGRGSLGDSAAQTGALGKSITEGLAPTLFNQYNQNVQNAMGASGQLMSGAQGTSGALDQAAGNQLGAQTAAPGSLSNLNQPQMMALAAEAARRGIPIQNLQDLQSLILPIAQTGQQGTSSGTQTSQTQSNPWQTALGAAMGGVGILGSGGAFGTGGLFGGLFGK